MQDLIIKRIQKLTEEVEMLSEEKKTLSSRLNEIEIRLHQLVGAIYEMQMLLNLENRSSDSEKTKNSQ